MTAKDKLKALLAEQEFELHSYAPRIRNNLMSNGIEPDKTLATITVEQFYKLLLIFNRYEKI